MPPKKINPKYIPKSLTKEDKAKQIKSIREGKDRPIVKSFTSKRSPWVKKFEEKYKTKITDFEFIYKNIIKKPGVDLIIKKGYGAYYNKTSGGSRPNQTAESWSYARLASVLLGGPARAVDAKIWDKYKIKK